MKNIYIYNKKDEQSEKLTAQLSLKLSQAGFNVQKTFVEDGLEATDMTIVVGGDGAFLKAVHATKFSTKPILGINNGHLGFFSEFESTQLDKVVEVCKTEKYQIQKHKVIKIVVDGENGEYTFDPALNDVAVKKSGGSLIHLNVSIGDKLIEKFSGDGILISSSAGSTAYNYSLGGSIVDPALDLLQVTPMAPANNTAYRSFTSSLLLPGTEKIVITSDEASGSSIIIDGEEHVMLEFKRISISLSENEVQIVRLPGYSFWNKVTSKFL
ncbi:MAG: NAD(+)/NADH kinase [Bacillota bacterium]|nr:NAD(+)/NADH kinase [Bacillota bacterium]